MFLLFERGFAFSDYTLLLVDCCFFRSNEIHILKINEINLLTLDKVIVKLVVGQVAMCFPYCMSHQCMRAHERKYHYTSVAGIFDVFRVIRLQAHPSQSVARRPRQF